MRVFADESTNRNRSTSCFKSFSPSFHRWLHHHILLKFIRNPFVRLRNQAGEVKLSLLSSLSAKHEDLPRRHVQQISITVFIVNIFQYTFNYRLIIYDFPLSLFISSLSHSTGTTIQRGKKTFSLLHSHFKLERKKSLIASESRVIREENDFTLISLPVKARSGFLYFYEKWLQVLLSSYTLRPEES